jgi:hypothetical protein
MGPERVLFEPLFTVSEYLGNDQKPYSWNDLGQVGPRWLWLGHPKPRRRRPLGDIACLG